MAGRGFKEGDLLEYEDGSCTAVILRECPEEAVKIEGKLYTRVLIRVIDVKPDGEWSWLKVGAEGYFNPEREGWNLIPSTISDKEETLGIGNQHPNQRTGLGND